MRSLRACAPVLALLALAGGAARADTTHYQCTGYRPLDVELDPQKAVVHFEGDTWTLRRVHDSGEARYVDNRDGVWVVTKGREMTFQHHDTRLACNLLSDALAPPTPPSSPH